MPRSYVESQTSKPKIWEAHPSKAFHLDAPANRSTPAVPSIKQSNQDVLITNKETKTSYITWFMNKITRFFSWLFCGCVKSRKTDTQETTKTATPAVKPQTAKTTPKQETKEPPKQEAKAQPLRSNKLPDTDDLSIPPVNIIPRAYRQSPITSPSRPVVSELATPKPQAAPFNANPRVLPQNVLRTIPARLELQFDAPSPRAEATREPAAQEKTAASVAPTFQKEIEELMESLPHEKDFAAFEQERFREILFDGAKDALAKITDPKKKFEACKTFTGKIINQSFEFLCIAPKEIPQGIKLFNLVNSNVGKAITMQKGCIWLLEQTLRPFQQSNDWRKIERELTDLTNWALPEHSIRYQIQKIRQQYVSKLHDLTTHLTSASPYFGIVYTNILVETQKLISPNGYAAQGRIKFR